MKKIILLIVVPFMFGCEKDEVDPIIYDVTVWSQCNEYLSDAGLPAWTWHGEKTVTQVTDAVLYDILQTADGIECDRVEFKNIYDRNTIGYFVDYSENMDL